MEPSRIAQFASECFADSDIDLLFASCTNFRAIDAREEIQATLGVPVVTSNHAALVCVLDQIGAPATVDGRLDVRRRLRLCPRFIVDRGGGALAKLGDEAHVIAGGQSLVPMMMLRFSSPSALMDISGADERTIELPTTAR